ncbi:MAG: 30S ribosomal protein S16 [Parachlamydiales bacterium]|nr:30S ribosomal protein S16 [Parachlamydiales bacterium]
MALKIRLRQQGRTNRPFYRLVLTDSRSPRDGKYLEMLGWYNPFETQEDRLLNVRADRVQHWVSQGAQISEAAQTLIKKVAPTILQEITQKSLALRAKLTQKQRERRKRRRESESAKA